MKYLIIGLGNVGPEYELTRHNIGFRAVNYLSQKHRCNFQLNRLAWVAYCRYRGRSVHLIKPTTYMNHSGKAARYWLEKLKLPVAHSLAVVDDVALPFGKLRMKARGSSGGHNGLQSLEEHLNTQAYPRLRVGIGRDFTPDQQKNYVLAPFQAHELTDLPMCLHQACEMILAFCTLGVSKTMERYN